MMRRKQRRLRRDEDAVSAVVGVMLMLVVTVIIAAVVSGYAGGLVGGSNQKAPTLAMDVKIVTTGGSPGFSGTVTGASEPVSTKNLKIVTSWVKITSTGTRITGSGTSVSGTKAPWGFGPGVSGPQNLPTLYSNPNATFGNYTMMSGTGLTTSTNTSELNTVLGTGWQNLTAGDIVGVSIVYTPSGKVIFQKDVAVTEG